jgi:hypothetical protein
MADAIATDVVHMLYRFMGVLAPEGSLGPVSFDAAGAAAGVTDVPTKVRDGQ